MISTILTDIEGTTSSIAFVHEVLFPYARKRLPAYVRAHQNDPEVAAALRDIGAPTVEDAIAQLDAWMAADAKVTPLKALQGLVWEEGYRGGELLGHIYEDAFEGLNRWKARGLTLCVYSSGSEQAQKLIFGHTPRGDLTPLFSGFFDTRVGAKRESKSYAEIARRLGVPPESILFLSDVEAELDAAHTAGLRTTLVARDGQTSARHPVARSFAEVQV